MDYQPAEFREIPYGSLEAAACAPRLPGMRFRGIIIRAPDRIVASVNERIKLPICGVYQLATLPLLQGAVMIVHVKAAGVAPISGQVVISDGENEPDMPDPAENTPIDPRLYAHKVSESYFYLDGQRYLPHSLPAGVYDVHVSYGRDQSNVVRIEIARN